MAKFSQQFLANLGRPQMAESLFGLGAAIGGVPGQMKQKHLPRHDPSPTHTRTLPHAHTLSCSTFSSSRL